jgi:succinate dehydrogenase / fumarate reductase flavoprotein subunit
MIRTLQDYGIHLGIDVHMECTITALLMDGNRVAGALAYERERGRFRIFKSNAVVLATGGVGRAYKITSNSWEYTGDGISLAYQAGAELIDMEFLQFHPTGMIWPPSVQGILVTEGVRGEGGILLNKNGERFMFDDIPELYRNQTADNEDEGWRYTQGDRNARRPPELLTRDHVARCIVRQIKEGKGSPHNGVYLDISWIKNRMPRAAEHIKKKLPSMYHQFKKLADIDITAEPMEVGPTTHYMMGGIPLSTLILKCQLLLVCLLPANARRVCMDQIVWAGTLFQTYWFLVKGQENMPQHLQRRIAGLILTKSKLRTRQKKLLNLLKESKEKVRFIFKMICRR